VWTLIGLVAAACGRPPANALAAPDVASGVQRALGAAARSARLLESTLVACADHELNASSFAARVAASTGADLEACLLAALAAFSGPRHGAESARVQALVTEAGRPERAGGDRLVAEPGVRPVAEPLEVVAEVVLLPVAAGGERAHPAATGVRIEGLHLHPQQPRRLPRVHERLMWIVESRWIHMRLTLGQMAPEVHPWRIRWRRDSRAWWWRTRR